MASGIGFAGAGLNGSGFDKLHEGGMDVLRDAKATPTYQEAEQEAKERRIAQLMSDQRSMPMTVNEVTVTGAQNIRRSFLHPIISPLLSDGPNPPSTVGDVLSRLQEASNRLSALQILRQPPSVFLSQADPTDATSTPTDVNISIGLRELGRFKLQTGTDVGNGEGSAYGSLLWRNMFGGAEMLSLNAKSGTRTRSAYSANLSAPVFSNPDMRVSLEALASAAEKPWASHEEVLKGGSVQFSWLNLTKDTHSVEYSGLWRQITSLGEAASTTVRHDAGDSFKSAIRHTFYRERRDNPQLPQNGYMFRSRMELAGIGPLGGDAAFSKSDIEMSGALPVPIPGIQGKSGISVGAGLRMGVLYPLAQGFGSDGKVLPSRLNDRFQLGGPTDVRGFKLGGLGPHDSKDAVGGDVFAAGSVNMLMPLPYKGPESALRFQVFANGGRLVAMKPQAKTEAGQTPQNMTAATVRDGMANAAAELFRGAPTIAAGMGLVYAHPVARFELNFSLPLVLRKGELATKGLQLGVGINFM